MTRKYLLLLVCFMAFSLPRGAFAQVITCSDQTAEVQPERPYLITVDDRYADVARGSGFLVTLEQWGQPPFPFANPWETLLVTRDGRRSGTPLSPFGFVVTFSGGSLTAIQIRDPKGPSRMGGWLRLDSEQLIPVECR